MAVRHFLSLMDLQPQELRRLIERARELKTWQHEGLVFEPLKNRVLGMIFEKSSTRTRVSFEVAMAQSGGHAIFLSPRDTQLGRGEPIEDSARVLSRMVDAAMLRTFSHETVETFAAYASVPVINGLTDRNHPCQLLADMLTYFEHRGDISGHTVTYIGDGNNMCNSYINAAIQFDFNLRIACPPGYEPSNGNASTAGDRVQILHEPLQAARNSHLIVTDVWASMGQEDEQTQRRRDFEPFQVTQQVMDQADPQALFMHCLPAHRGEEVAAEVIDGPQSVVFDESENRLHAQKALLEFLLT